MKVLFILTVIVLGVYVGLQIPAWETTGGEVKYHRLPVPDTPGRILRPLPGLGKSMEQPVQGSGASDTVDLAALLPDLIGLGFGLLALVLIVKRPEQTALMVFAAGVLSTLFTRYVGPLVI